MYVRDANVGTRFFLREMTDFTNRVSKGKGGEGEGEKLRQWNLIFQYEVFHLHLNQIFF